MSEKLITPQASQRATNPKRASPEKNPDNSQTTTRKNTNPTHTSKKVHNKKSSLNLRDYFNQFLLLITLLIATFSFYFSWSGDDSKWQVESINELQNKVRQQQLKMINFKKQLELTNLNANKKTTAIDELDNNLTVKLTDKLNTEISQLKQAIDKLMKNQQAGKKLKNATAEDLSQQLKILQDEQAQISKQNTVLQKQIANQQNTTTESILAISKLSNLQIRRWVLQINNQWLFENNKFTTLNSLHALAETLALSKKSYKKTVLEKIRQDQQTVENFTPPTIATDKITNLKTWLHSLQLTSTTKSVTDNKTEQSNWQLIKEKFSGLFSIRKKESAGQLSIVETKLGKRILKQRMLLQAGQLGWAIHSQSPQVIQYAMDDISMLIEQHAPKQLNTWQLKMINMMPTSQMAKSPLSITEVDYVNHH